MWGNDLLGRGVVEARGEVAECKCTTRCQDTTTISATLQPCEDRNTIFRLMVYGYKELWRTITVNNSKRETICGLCVELRGDSSQ